MRFLFALDFMVTVLVPKLMVAVVLPPTEIEATNPVAERLSVSVIFAGVFLPFFDVRFQIFCDSPVKRALVPSLFTTTPVEKEARI